MNIRTIVGLLLVTFASAPAHAFDPNWNLTFKGNVPLPNPASGTVLEQSCVSYIGPVGNAYRFISAEQDHDNVVRFDVSFTADGAIASIANVVNIPIDKTIDDNDFEGIVYTNATRNSVFLSDERGPSVVELSLATGKIIQTVAIPSVFNNIMSNRGLESLTRTLDTTTMWTGNEEALTVDGLEASDTEGTVVRLLKLNVSGNTVTAGPQYAYKTEPIHSTNGASRNGLNDLCMMPDGTLLSLERSAATGPPGFFNRIFEIDFAGATDISAGATANGLAGKPYTPVDKEELWKGTINPPNGKNFEGLGLGPRLPNGSWVVLGTIDSSTGGSDNTIVAFNATPNVTADFNDDGVVDGGDFLAWQTGLGATVGATLAQGDGDRDGDVDADDLQLWQTAIAPPPTHAVPEPGSAALIAAAALVICRSRRRMPCLAKS